MFTPLFGSSSTNGTAGGSALTEVDLFNQALAGVGAYRIEVDAAKNIAMATASATITVTSLAHGYATGDLILILHLAEMVELNRRVFRVDVVDVDAFTLRDEDGSEYLDESTGGIAQRLSTGEEIESVFRIWRQLRREVLEEHSWNEATRYIRLARLAEALDITAVTQAQQARVTIAAHGYANGNQALIDGVLGMVELNGRLFTVANATTNTFELSGENSTDYAAYASAGTARKVLVPLKPDFGYARRYDLPADCVRVLSLAEEGHEDRQWEVVGGEMLTDEGPTVPIRYTHLIRDPAAFGSKLFSAFAARLAHELAPKLTDSVSREERAQARWEDQLDRAKRTDGQEQGLTAIVDSRWISERY